MPRFVALTGGVTGSRIYVNPETVAQIATSDSGCAITFVDDIDNCIYVHEPVEEVARLLSGQTQETDDSNDENELLRSIVASWSEEGLAALSGIVATPEKGFGVGEDGPRLFRSRAVELRALVLNRDREVQRLRDQIQQANAHIRVLMGEATPDA